MVGIGSPGEITFAFNLAFGKSFRFRVAMKAGPALLRTRTEGVVLRIRRHVACHANVHKLRSSPSRLIILPTRVRQIPSLVKTSLLFGKARLLQRWP